MFRTNKKYNVFISHSWKQSEVYDKVKGWLDASNIIISDYSVPASDPFGKMSNKKLAEAITEQIRHAAVVIVIADMYSAYSSWIDYEIDEAVRMEKPILGVYPRGQQRTVLKITENAKLMVKWNSDSVINGIKKLLQ